MAGSDRADQIRIARHFGRVDVDQFMHEITAQEYIEQLAFDEAMKRRSERDG